MDAHARRLGRADLRSATALTWLDGTTGHCDDCFGRRASLPWRPLLCDERAYVSRRPPAWRSATAVVARAPAAAAAWGAP